MSVPLALAKQYLEQHSLFGLWAVARRLPVLPTLPRHVADFVATNYPAMELDALIAATLEVSRLHTGNGLADPCTGAVTAAFQAIKPISPPHGWPTEERVRFTELPYSMQKYLASHDGRRDKEIKRSHREAAALRKELAAMKPTEEKTDVDTEKVPAA